MKIERLAQWDDLRQLAVPSETVRTHLEKTGWEPTARQMAAIIYDMRLFTLAQKRTLLRRLDTRGDETLAAQIQALLQDWERTLQSLADNSRDAAGAATYREDGALMKLPTGLAEDPAHFINDPPASETAPSPFRVGDIVWCTGAEGERALYLGQEHGIVVPAGEERRKSPGTTFPGRDGERLRVEFLNEQGDFTYLRLSPWGLERSTPLGMDEMSWRYLKQGRELLLGRGSFCEFLSAREAFCRVFPKLRAKRHGEIDAILKESVERLEKGEVELIPAEEFFAELHKKLFPEEKDGAKAREKTSEGGFGMLTLYDWALETASGECAITAAGYVTGHPSAKLYDGCRIRTSPILAASVEEDRLCLRTLSGHLYTLAPEAVDPDRREETGACLSALGVDEDFTERCVRARTQAQARHGEETERTLEPGELLLEVVGARILRAVFRAPGGELMEVEPAVHAGTIQARILITDMLKKSLEPRHVPVDSGCMAQSLKTVKVRNLGSAEAFFGVEGDQTPCPAGALTAIPAARYELKRARLFPGAR